MSLRSLWCLALLSSCHPPTPAEDVQALHAHVKVAETGCKVYLIVPGFPRDALLDQKCPDLVKP